MHCSTWPKADYQGPALQYPELTSARLARRLANCNLAPDSTSLAPSGPLMEQLISRQVTIGKTKSLSSRMKNKRLAPLSCFLCDSTRARKSLCVKTGRGISGNMFGVSIHFISHLSAHFSPPACSNNNNDWKNPSRLDSVQTQPDALLW